MKIFMKARRAAGTHSTVEEDADTIVHGHQAQVEDAADQCVADLDEHFLPLQAQ